MAEVLKYCNSKQLNVNKRVDLYLEFIYQLRDSEG